MYIFFPNRFDLFNPRPDGPLDFPPPDEGGSLLAPPPPVARLLHVVARNRNMRWKARWKALLKHFGQFFAKVNIEVNRGHQISNLAEFHISSGMYDYIIKYFS